MSSMGLFWGIATGKPRGRPRRVARRSIRAGRGWGVEKVIRRPMPAFSKPGGGDGFGWIVLRVCGVGVKGCGVLVADCGAG